MFLHYLVASAFQTLVPLVSSSFIETSNISEVGYADVANRYVSLKYSNNYLRFWDDASEHYSLRARKTQVIYSDSKAANFFKKVKGSNGEGWRGLVLFCKKMRNKIEDGKDLGNRQLKYIGFCDRDEFIPVSKDMSKRFYWVDQLARAKYNPSDFTFWDRLFEEVGERSHKLHELRKQGYVGDLPEILGRAKRECQALRDKFNSKDKFTEEDLKIEIPKCISSLKTTR